MRTGLISVSFFSPSQERIEINALTKISIPPKILGKIPKTKKREKPTVKNRTNSTKSPRYILRGGILWVDDTLHLSRR